ncbi:MAG: cytochrome c biogenesis protein CcdA [Prevotellaceae bacterium]|nr:cytochrome c biogenesis protein CcdA [Prevotellaceae bacterium]
MKKYLFSIALLALQATLAVAQIMEPVKFTTSCDGKEVVFKAKIDKGWHVYSVCNNEDCSGPIWATLTVNTAEGIELVGTLKAEGKEQTVFDDMFGMDVTYFEDSVTFIQEIKQTKEDYKLDCDLEYGTCNDEMCMPPTKVNCKYESASFTQGKNNGETEESTELWPIFIAGLIGGLLALLTPCVWPMIPMTVSFFLKRNKDKKKAIREAVTYGLSIVVIYLILGLAVTLIFGAAAMNELATNAIANIFFAVLLIVFALSFFGLFEIKLPDSWGNKIDNMATSRSQAAKGKSSLLSTFNSYLSILLMALVLVVVSFSCTGPLIGVLLVTVAASGEILAPTIGMLGFALALAIPFAFFAMFPNWLKAIPKSGSWMNVVKVSLAFIELAFALKFLSVTDMAYGWGILPRTLFIVLWIAIFGAMAIYGIYTIVKSRKALILKLIVTLIGAVITIYLIPGLNGAPLKQVSAFLPPMEQNLNEHHFEDYYVALDAAKKQGKPIFIDFTGYGCVNCRKMEAAVFTNPEVKRLMEEEYIVVTLYVDDRRKDADGTPIGEKWSKLQQEKYGANAQPYYVLIDANETVLTDPRSYDEDIDAFIEFLQKGLGAN